MRMLAGRDDGLVRVGVLLKSVQDWWSFLAEPDPADLPARLRRHENTGRPLGSREFEARLEARLGRPLAPRRAGRKPMPTDKQGCEK